MRRASLVPVALLLAGCMPAAAWAQMPAPCPAVAAAGGEFAAWTAAVDHVAGGAAAQPAVPDLPIGQAQRLALAPQDQVKFAGVPGKAGAAGSYAGSIALAISEPGRYRVAVGTGAWVDLVDHGQAVASSAHEHGPACSGIRKIVDFPLHAGSYILQISANAEPRTTVLVVRAR